MDGNMRAAVYHNNNDIRIVETPIPEIGPGELLVKVMACGICGSDVMEWYRIKSAPRVLGHEATGQIARVGEGVRYKVGDRVFVSHHVPCNKCHYCLNGHHTACETLHTTNFDPGGFSEYVRVPEINVKTGVYLLSEKMSYEEGTFIEPLGCVIRAQRLAGVKATDSVLIIGSGISGLLHVKLARAVGVRRIIVTDVNEYRLKMAKRFGAEVAMHAENLTPENLRKVNEGMLADQVIVCTGAAPAVDQAIQCADRGGNIMFFAVPKPGTDVPIPINDFWRNEISMMTSYGAAPKNLEESLMLISSRRVRVDDMITHVMPLEKISEGFRMVAHAEKSIKVIIKPNKQ